MAPMRHVTCGLGQALAALHLQDLSPFVSLTAIQTLCFSVDDVVEALPDAAPTVMPALERIESFGVNHLPQILAAAAMPNLSFLQFVGNHRWDQPGAQLDCVSCLTALKQLHMRHMQLEGSTLHLGALPQLVILDLEDVTMEPGNMVLRGGTTLQTLGLDCDSVMDEMSVAAVEALPCLRQVILYMVDDMFDLSDTTIGSQLYLARLQDTLMARGCQIDVVEAI